MRPNHRHLRQKYQGLETLESRLLMSVDTIGSTMATAQAMSLTGGTGSYASAIDSSTDKDLFYLTAPASGTMTIKLNATGTPAVNPYLSAFNASGILIAANDNFGSSLNSQLTISVTSGQKYYLQASSSFSTTGTYSLQVTSAFDTVGNTMATAAVITPTTSGSGTAASAIEYAGDKDVFSFVAPLSGALKINLNASGSPAVDTILTAYDASGAQLGVNDDFGGSLNSQLILVVTAGQKYFIQASAYGSSTGTYALQLLTTPDLIGNTPATAQALSLSTGGAGSAASSIDYSTDKDVFSLIAPISGTMKINLNAAAGSTLNPYLAVLDVNGVTLAQNDDFSGTNSQITLTVTAGVKYFIQASSSASTTGNYTLQVGTTATTNTTVLPAFLPAETVYSPLSVVTGSILTTTAGEVLVIRGTDTADAITLSQLGNTISVTVGTAAPLTFTATTSFVGVALYGFGGDDTLRETFSMASSLSTVVYGGSGNDAIFDNAPDKAWLFGGDGNDKLVSIGTTVSVVTGGLGTDSFWVDANDLIVDKDAAEIAGKNIHVITAFTAPTSNAANTPTLQINGQDLIDPVATDPNNTSVFYSYSNAFKTRPLFAGTPQYNDILQGYTGDCYFLAALSSLAQSNPNYITQSITDLGDGTYAVRFFNSSSQEQYYRIDAQLPSANGGSSPVYAKLTRNGSALWVALLEKAFAQFRRGQNSYDSIQGGWMSEGYQAIIASGTVSQSTTSIAAATLAQNMANSLAAGHCVTAATNGTTSSYIIGGHAYEVRAVTLDTATNSWYVTVYNPWGVDGGTTFDTNSGDGLLRLSISAFITNYGYIQTSVA